MEVACIPFKKTGYFSSLIADYLDKNPKLRPFYSRFPDIEEFESHQTRYKKSENAGLQLDDYTKKRLQEIDGNINSVSDDPYDLVSRKK